MLSGKVIWSMFVSLLLIAGAAGNGWAQGDKNKGEIDIPKFGGPGVMLFFPEFDQLNKEIELLGYPTYKGSFFLIGGGGYGVINKNWRIGGFGGSSILGCNIDISKNEKKGDKESDLNIEFGGLTVEYAKNRGSWNVSAGGLLGLGGITLQLYDSQSKDLVAFKDTYLIYGPLADIAYQVNKTIALGLSAGYVVSKIDGKWQGTSSSPKSSVDMSGPYACVRVIFTME